MSRKGFNLNKGTVGVNVLDRNDSISGLLASGIAATGLALGVTKMITSPKDARALGIDEAYDNTNNVRVYRHISEFYRMSEEGIPLYLMLYPQAVTPATAFSNVIYAQKLISDTSGKIRNLGIAYNPPTGYTPTTVDGIEENVRLAIVAAQTFADWTYETYRPVHVAIEGRGISATSSSALDLRGIVVSGAVVEYNEVSLMIGQDWDYAETRDAIGKKMADVGTLLGAIASRNVGENVAEVGVVNLTNNKKANWLTAGISSHIKTTTIDADLDQWDAKGYVFGWDYQSDAAPGYRLNNDHVCAPIIEDEDNNTNISSISLSRTNGKVVRALRDAYIPKLHSVQDVDAATGLMTPGTVKYMEGFGNDVFKVMGAKRELSGGETVVDKLSNLTSGEKSLGVAYNWVPMGSINQINGVLNIKSKLS